MVARHSNRLPAAATSWKCHADTEALTSEVIASGWDVFDTAGMDPAMMNDSSDRQTHDAGGVKGESLAGNHMSYSAIRSNLTQIAQTPRSRTCDCVILDGPFAETKG